MLFTKNNLSKYKQQLEQQRTQPGERASEL